MLLCLRAPFITSPAFSQDQQLFGGWSIVGRFLESWFLATVHDDDLDVLWEWKHHHAATREQKRAAVRANTLDGVPEGWVAAPKASKEQQPGPWRLGRAETLTLLPFLEPAEAFALAQSSAALWRWMRKPANLAPAWGVMLRAHAAAEQALAKAHRGLPSHLQQQQQQAACRKLEQLAAATTLHPIRLEDLLRHCTSPGSNSRRLSAKLEFAVEAYWMMSQPDGWYKPASKYGSRLCSNWEAASAHALRHATSGGPLSAAVGGVTVEGVVSMLGLLPEGCKNTLPARLLPWTTVMMRPEWDSVTAPDDGDAEAAAADRLGSAFALLVLAADTAARVATGAVTEPEGMIRQLCARRLRHFAQLAAADEL